MDVYPSSGEIFERLYRGEPDGGDAAAYQTWLRQMKAVMLRLWHGVLSQSEEREIRGASSERMLHAMDVRPFAQRVRLRVQEWLEGDYGESFEVWTEATSCGYRFRLDGEYLVVAFAKTATGRWRTGACSRTAPAESTEAREGTDFLRAWRSGNPLRPRVFGKVTPAPRAGPWSPAPGVRVTLQRPGSGLGTTTDQAGRFAFENLEAANYQLDVAVPGWEGKSSEVDLTANRCVQSSIFLEDGERYVILFEGIPKISPPPAPVLPPPPVLNPSPPVVALPIR
jgi:hypothetical protein